MGAFQRRLNAMLHERLPVVRGEIIKWPPLMKEPDDGTCVYFMYLDTSCHHLFFHADTTVRCKGKLSGHWTAAVSSGKFDLVIMWASTFQGSSKHFTSYDNG